MTHNNRDYGPAEGSEPPVELLRRIASYHKEDLEMEEEYRNALHAAGTIKAFSRGVDSLNEYMVETPPEEREASEVRRMATKVGRAWVDARESYNAIDRESAETVEKFTARALRDATDPSANGEPPDASGERSPSPYDTVSDQIGLQQQYTASEASAIACSKRLGGEGFDTPVGVAAENADGPVACYFEHLQSDIPESREESHNQLLRLAEEHLQ